MPPKGAESSFFDLRSRGAESSFLDFLESYSEYNEPWGGKKQKETLYDMWKESGSPYVKDYSREELLAQDKIREIPTYSEDPRAFFTRGERTMWDAIGMWGKGRAVNPDTLHIQQDNLQEFLAELAHAEQFKDKWDFGPGTRSAKSRAAYKKYGEDVYDVEYLEELEPEMAVETSYYTGRPFPQRKTKSIEYEAHREIQPRMVRRAQESFK